MPRGMEEEMMPRMAANVMSGSIGGMAQPAVPGGMAQPVQSPMPQAPTMGRAMGGGMSPAAMQEGATMGRAMGGQEIIQPPQPVQSPMPQAPTMGRAMGGRDILQPPQPVQSPMPQAPTMGRAGGRAEMDNFTGGTGLTPATPSAAGGGSGTLPTATVGGGMPPPPIMGGPSGGIGGGEMMPPPPIMGGPSGGMGGGEMMPQAPTMGSSGGGSMSDEYITPGGPNTQSLTGANTGGEIAQQFGFDSEEYGGYFTPISDKMKAAGTEAGYTGMLNEQRAQLRDQSGQAKQGLRASLLQDRMMAQQAAGSSGFAGGGAQQQAMNMAGQSRQLQADQLTSQYGRGMYGVRQQIAGRVAAGQQALSSAQSAMYDRALQLQKSGASMSGGGGSGGGSGGGDGSILGMTQPTVTDTAITTGVTGRESAGGSSQTDPTMGNVNAGSGQGPNSFGDPDNQVTGDAYDEMIAQQQEAARQAALQQTNNYVPPRPKRVIASERKANVGIG